MRLLRAWWLVPAALSAWLWSCDDDADDGPDAITCEVGEHEPGMACDQEGQVCSYADAGCVYRSECVGGRWTDGTLSCADTGPGPGSTSASASASTGAGAGGSGGGMSLRFYGNGVGDIDRVKIRVDQPPPDSAPGPPVDVGATDFTIELFLRGSAADNPAGAVACGDNIAWINGNIVLDRDRFNQDRKFGVSIAGGVVVFGVSGDGTGDHTVCSTSDVLDGSWHHVAAARRRSDGRMWLFVDGILEAEEDGPDGDVSYPDDGVPGDYCGGPCTGSDPFLVIAAEKHDAGPSYPSFSGLVDELRLSSALRYTASFAPPVQPFTPDAQTVGLYHFDEGTGDVAADSSGAPGGPSDGELRIGGTPEGPMWAPDSPFGG
jgi:hypothetical protein